MDFYLGKTLLSIYLTLSETKPEFPRRFDALGDALLDTDGRILAGWVRGCRLNDACLMRTPEGKSTYSTSTFRVVRRKQFPRNLYVEIIVIVDGGRVLEEFSASDRQYIAFEVVFFPKYITAWKIAMERVGRFVEALGTGRIALIIKNKGYLDLPSS